MTDPLTPPAAEPKPPRRLLKPRKATLYAQVASLNERNDWLRSENMRLCAELVEARAHPLRLWWRRVMEKG